MAFVMPPCRRMLQFYTCVQSTQMDVLVSKLLLQRPVKTLIIPRLELLGAVLLAGLGNTVSKSLTHQYNLTYWIYSTAALYWIANDKPWKQYVSNRVKKICQLTNQDQWRHCPGQLNPEQTYPHVDSRNLSLWTTKYGGKVHNS